MDLHDYLVILRERWRSIIVVTAVGAILGVLGWLFLPASYTSEAAVLISVQNGETAREILGGSSYAVGQVQSYAEVARSPFVQQPALDGLKTGWTQDELDKTDIDVTVAPSTSVIRIDATANDVQLATRVAGAVADQLVKAVENLSPADSGGQRTVRATVITPAEQPIERSGPKPAPLITVGLLVGLGLGLVQALVRGALPPATADESPL
jgi:capsular polysaccharide biosynthesis protein